MVQELAENTAVRPITTTTHGTTTTTPCQQRGTELLSISLLDIGQFSELPYILAYKSQNLRPNLDQKVGRATYTRVIKKEIFTTGRTGLTETCQDTDTSGE